MKAIGVIAEYNPFHNGHLYHLGMIKDKYKDYKVILVMSGNFVQRGDVSILDKWKKCEIALKMGIDLVVELPYSFATQSADYFSYGAITILEMLKVEKVVFGSESNNIKDLEEIAKAQINNSNFERLVQVYSKMGYNYPTAISNSVLDLTGKKVVTPNDLLGVSYIKTIISNNYKIKAETIKRVNNFHDKNLDEEIASATAIREALKNGIDVSKQVPDIVKEKLSDLHFLDNYFHILKYKIITSDNLDMYQTVDEGFDKLLKKVIVNVNNLDELIEGLKSKRYTYNKIRRTLLHILCSFTKDDALAFRKINYIRVLGLNKNGKDYLNTIKKDIDIPIISKVQREKDPMLEFELETTKIYDIISNNNLFRREFERIIYYE